MNIKAVVFDAKMDKQNIKIEGQRYNAGVMSLYIFGLYAAI